MNQLNKFELYKFDLEKHVESHVRSYSQPMDKMFKSEKNKTAVAVVFSSKQLNDKDINYNEHSLVEENKFLDNQVVAVCLQATNHDSQISLKYLNNFQNNENSIFFKFLNRIKLTFIANLDEDSNEEPSDFVILSMKQNPQIWNQIFMVDKTQI